MDNEQLFELMSKMYGEMQEGFKGVKDEFKGVNERLDKIEDRVTVIEQDHGKKIDLLFDGYKQNAQILDRIEQEVSKHEEVIIRRVKWTIIIKWLSLVNIGVIRWVYLGLMNM